MVSETYKEKRKFVTTDATLSSFKEPTKKRKNERKVAAVSPRHPYSSVDPILGSNTTEELMLQQDCPVVRAGMHVCRSPVNCIWLYMTYIL